MFLVDGSGDGTSQGRALPRPVIFYQSRRRRDQREISVCEDGQSDSVLGMLQERKSKAKTERTFFRENPVPLKVKEHSRKFFKRFHPSRLIIILSGEKCLYIMHSRQSESKDT